MRTCLKSVSFLALGMMLGCTLLCTAGKVEADTNRLIILIGTVVWFFVTPTWMKKTN